MADGGDILQRWFAAAELAGLPGLPGTTRRVTSRAQREHWLSRKRDGHGGGREYAFSSLPEVAQTALLMREHKALCATEANGAATQQNDRAESAWSHYNAAPQSLKDVAACRMQAVLTIDTLRAGDITLTQARELVSEQLRKEHVKGASPQNLARWQQMVADAPRVDWLALLLPAYVGRTATAPCDARAWEWYKAQWLTRRRPSHLDTYRRLQEIAAAQGWDIPSARTLVRRIEKEIAPNTIMLLREGPEAAARKMPVQQRLRDVFGAGEAVNGDGLKFDRLWVRFDDGEVLNTATAWFWQDLRSNRILAWRLGKTENTDIFRLATYDLTGVCAPTHVWMDNTRVAANKLMTAGARIRYRYTKDPDEGVGLLLMLGMEPHFTNPDKERGNPGSKPIERAFGIGGIHEKVATNPKLINRGYSKKTAITEHELREVIAFEVQRINAQTGRQTRVCRGVLSFDQAWEQALAERPPRVLSDAQRRVLLMCREVVRSDTRTGVVWLKAGRSQYDRNSYYCDHLARMAGRKMVAHYDPQNLHAGIHLYSLDGRYLFAAEYRPGRAYNDVAAARDEAKFKERLIKLNKKAAAETVRLDDLERARIYAAATGGDTPTPSKPAAHGTVISGHFQRVPVPARDAQRVVNSDVDTLSAGDRMILRMADRLKDEQL